MMLTLPLRLLPGQDLRRALEAAVATQGATAAFVVAGIGSLSRVVVRLAGAVEAEERTGDFEVLTLSGTIAGADSHLHASLSDARGAVFGGHLGLGCIVRTTAEVMLTVLDDWDFSREPDPATGYRELTMRARPAPATRTPSPSPAAGRPPRASAEATPASASARLFLALWPDEAACDAVARWQQAAEWPSGAVLTRRANWHATLHFLGAVPRDSMAALRASLPPMTKPIELVFDTFAVWHGGAAVLECRSPPAELATLHGELADRLGALGLRLEVRSYRPHLTLARQATGAQLARVNDPPPRWRADAYALVESLGGRYLVVERFPVRAR